MKSNISTFVSEAQEAAYDSIMDNMYHGEERFYTPKLKLITLRRDPGYQSDYRISASEKKDVYRKMQMDWNEDLLEPIKVVPHPEEKSFYVVDGWHRYVVAEMMGLTCLPAMVLCKPINEGMSAEQRRIYEAKLFSHQKDNELPVKDIQLQGAKLIEGDAATLLIQKMEAKYGFKYVQEKGHRDGGVIGSYNRLYRLANSPSYGEGALDYIFTILAESGFNRLPNGYAAFVIDALRDAYKLWSSAREREISARFLANTLRKLTPFHLRNLGCGAYPYMSVSVAVSKFLEDELCYYTELTNKRKLVKNGTKLALITEDDVA